MIRCVSILFALIGAISALPARAAVPPPLPAASAQFTAGSLRVQMFGTPGKQAVVFIPGLACGPWEWSREITQLTPAYTVYALTLPGFDTTPAIRGPLFHTVTADFWNMLKTRRIARPAVIGHSLGGTLAIMLAEQHSSDLRGIIAVDGLPVFPGEEQATDAQREQSGKRLGTMLASLSTPAEFEAGEKKYSLPFLVKSADDIAAIAPLTARSDPRAAGAWADEDLSLDLRAGLSNITVPFLEVAPYDASLENARFANAAAKESYYASLISKDPDAKVTVIENSRHFIMYDQPSTLDAIIASFLQTVTAK